MNTRAKIIKIGQCWQDETGKWHVTNWVMDGSQTDAHFIEGPSLFGWPFEELATIARKARYLP